LGPEIAGKQLELLKEAVPTLSRMSVLWNSATLGNALRVGEAQAAARRLGIELQSLEARNLSDFDGAFAAMTAQRTGALLVLADVMFVAFRKRLIELAARSRLPAMYFQREFVDDGGLMSYSPNVADNFHRAAIYVDRILKGAKPADLPVERPTKFELIVN